MPGKAGQIPSKSRPGTMRARTWKSMRILRRFNVAELCRTTGARRNNVRKFLQRLAVHGYVQPFGTYVSGRTGEFQSFRLMRDIGPQHPSICDRCGRHLGAPCLGDSIDER